MNEPRKYEYDAILHEDPDSGGAMRSTGNEH